MQACKFFKALLKLLLLFRAKKWGIFSSKLSPKNPEKVMLPFFFSKLKPRTSKIAVRKIFRMPPIFAVETFELSVSL